MNGKTLMEVFANEDHKREEYYDPKNTLNEFYVEHICNCCHKPLTYPVLINKEHGGECIPITDEEWVKMEKCECIKPLGGVFVNGTVVSWSVDGKALQG